MAVDDVSILRVVGRYQKQNIVHTLHYQHSTQGSSEQEVLQQLCDAWDTDFSAAWVARHIDTYELVGVKAFVKTGAAKTPAFTDIATAGSVVGEELPASVCRTITLYTASAKFRRRGRVMLSGTAVSMLDTATGAVTEAEITALGTLANLLKQELSANGDSFSPCIPATAVDPVEVITDSTPRGTPALIRSRRIREMLIG